MKTLTLILCLSALCCSGCASIVCGDSKTIYVSSQPGGANFTIRRPNGQIVTQGVTPTNVTLQRGRGFFQAGDYTLHVSKEGYRDASKMIPQDLEAGWYLAGNLVFGGVIGWLFVDPLTGAMWDIHDVYITLPGGKEKHRIIY